MYILTKRDMSAKLVILGQTCGFMCHQQSKLFLYMSNMWIYVQSTIENLEDRKLFLIFVQSYLNRLPKKTVLNISLALVKIRAPMWATANTH